MKKFNVFLYLTLLLWSCGASIQSVVDQKAIPKPYINPLIVIPYENSKAYTFSKILKEKIELKFETEAQKVELLFLEQSSNSLTLNSKDSFEDKINYAIIDDEKDVVIIFRATDLRYYNNSLQSVSYEVAALETEKYREVWKANLSSKSSLGPSVFANKCAELVFEKLKSDGVL